MDIEQILFTSANALAICERILGRSIPKRTWTDWLRLAGVPAKRGVINRQLSQSQGAKLFILATWRKRSPKAKITAADLERLVVENEPEIDAAIDACVEHANEPKPITPPPTKILLTQVRQELSSMWGKYLPHRTWVRWRNLAGIEPYSRTCSPEQKERLVYILWRRKRQKNCQMSTEAVKVETKKKPSQTRFDEDFVQKSRLIGCSGSDLPRYLQLCGCYASRSTLYRTNSMSISGYERPTYSQSGYYSPSELRKWLIVMRAWKEMRSPFTSPQEEQPTEAVGESALSVATKTLVVLANGKVTVTRNFERWTAAYRNMTGERPPVKFKLENTTKEFQDYVKFGGNAFIDSIA